MYKILITSRSFGQLSDEPIKILEQGNIEYKYYNDEFDEEIFIKNIEDCHGLIIGAHELSKEAVARARKLVFVCKHGAGLDNIDIKLMEKRNIAVERVPAVNANAVADLTFGLIIAVSRKICVAEKNVSKGQWSKEIGLDIWGKKLGILGFGEIGKNVARRARGFNMEVVVYDPFLVDLDTEFGEFVQICSFEELIMESDIISLHLPLNKDTKKLIDKEAFEKMKTGVIIVNTSRGEIIDESALIEYIGNGRIYGAGLDVVEKEPLPKDSPLRNYDNVVITPHIGMYSYEATNAVSIIAAKKTVEFFQRLI